jgi:hypothetical protein
MVTGFSAVAMPNDHSVDVFVKSEHKHRFKDIPPMVDGIKVTVRTDLAF